MAPGPVPEVRPPCLPRGPSAGLRWKHPLPRTATRPPQGRKDDDGHQPGAGALRRSRPADLGVLDAAAADQSPRPGARPRVRRADRPLRAGPRADRGLRPAPGNAAGAGGADHPGGGPGRGRPAPAARLLAQRRPLDRRGHRAGHGPDARRGHRRAVGGAGRAVPGGAAAGRDHHPDRPRGHHPDRHGFPGRGADSRAGPAQPLGRERAQRRTGLPLRPPPGAAADRAGPGVARAADHRPAVGGARRGGVRGAGGLPAGQAVRRRPPARAHGGELLPGLRGAAGTRAARDRQAAGHRRPAGRLRGRRGLRAGDPPAGRGAGGQGPGRRGPAVPAAGVHPARPGAAGR